MEMISAPIFPASASPTAVFPTAVGPVRNQAKETSDMGLALTWKTNRATLRHLFYSSATDRRLCEEGYYVVKAEYFGMGRDGLVGGRMQQVQRQGRPAGSAGRRSRRRSKKSRRKTRTRKLVVTNFLEAIRKGDNEAATKLLTKVARQKAAETGRSVAAACK